MSKVYIGFSYPKKFKVGAWLISVWMQRNYSHAYVRFQFSEEIDFILQASHGMVHFRLYENFLKENKSVKEHEIKVKNLGEVLHNAIDLAGEKYSFITLVKIFLYDLAHNLGVKLSFTDSEGYICSELAGKVCNDCEGLTFDKPYYLLTPRDIDQALVNSKQA